MEIAQMNLLVVFAFFTLSGVLSTCPPDGAVTFNIISPEKYDRNFSDIAEDGMRPLGYVKGTYYYNSETPNPCVQLENTENKRVEIMVETIPEARICLKTEKAEEQSLCGQGNINQCRRTNAKSLHFEFFCDGECSESDVTFWYRFALSPNSSVKDPELWCDERDPNEYPSSLQGFIPSNANPKPAPKDDGDINSATTLRGFTVMSFLYVLLMYL